MTEKRFTTVELPMPTIWGIWYDGAYLSTNKICILLNEYVDVKKMNEELKIDVNSLLTHYNGLNAEYEWLKEENKHLKQRNKRQYNQLTELWSLIEAKDWETLTEMVKQMEEDEERLQEEWKCYE